MPGNHEILRTGSIAGTALQQNRVLRNTYALLALSMVPTVLGALVGIQLNFSFLAGSPFMAFLLFLGIAWGFMWGIEKNKDSGLGDLADDALDFAAAVRIEAGRRFVEEQHLRRQRPGARQRDALLFAARAAAGLPRRKFGQADARQRGQGLPPARLGGDAAQLEAVFDVGERRGAQHHRPLEHHRLRQCPRPDDMARRWTQQAVHEPQQGTLAGTVGAEDQRPAMADFQADVLDDAHAVFREAERLEPQPRSHRQPQRRSAHWRSR